MLDSLRVLRDVRTNHTLVSMIMLGGLGSFFVGASMQTAMPMFAHDLGAGSAGLAYGVLLFANGAGGVIGGILLEATGRHQAHGAGGRGQHRDLRRDQPVLRADQQLPARARDAR